MSYIQIPEGFELETIINSYATSGYEVRLEGNSISLNLEVVPGQGIGGSKTIAKIKAIYTGDSKIICQRPFGDKEIAWEIDINVY